MTTLIERMAMLPTAYLAHEYMNDAWRRASTPTWPRRSPTPSWNGPPPPTWWRTFPELTLTPEQRAVSQRFDDPLVRELIKDMCLDRSLRHDVFVRGARHITPARANAALMDVWLALNISPEEMPYEVEMPAGQAALNKAFYGPIAEAMAQGPRRVGDLLALPDLEGRRDNPAELIGILVGLDLAEPALRPGAEPTPRRCASTA